jgi:DNA repair exonuclease SbcCD nuclease subunit
MEADVIVEHDGEMVKVDKDCFSKWDHTFLGHYHAQQQVADNVEYVGSPLQLNFGESFETKHICIFNPETGERKYVVNDFSPRHLVIPQADVEKYDLEGNFVRIVVDDLTSPDVVEMHQGLRNESGASSLELKPSRKKEDQQHLITDAKAILYKEEEMLEKYLDDVGIGELKEKKLLSIGKAICEGADEIE